MLTEVSSVSCKQAGGLNMELWMSRKSYLQVSHNLEKYTLASQPHNRTITRTAYSQKNSVKHLEKLENIAYTRFQVSSQKWHITLQEFLHAATLVSTMSLCFYILH